MDKPKLFGLPYVEKRVSDGPLWTFAMGSSTFKTNPAAPKTVENTFVWPSAELAEKAFRSLNGLCRGMIHHSVVKTSLPAGTPYYVHRVWSGSGYVDDSVTGYMYRTFKAARVDFKFYATILESTDWWIRTGIDLSVRDWSKPEVVEVA